jgi:hypothetical protein
MSTPIPENTEAEWAEKTSSAIIQCAKAIGDLKLRVNDATQVISALVVGLSDHSGKPKSEILRSVAALITTKP